MSCDYCTYSKPVDGYHLIPDPEGIEGTAKVLCSKEAPMTDETKTTTTTTTETPKPAPPPEPDDDDEDADGE